MAELDIAKLKEMTAAADEAVMLAENQYHNRIGGIADYVAGHSELRMLLLAGPSGSGKTTTANLIKDALIARGEESIVVSLDDFYRDATDPEYPRRPDGERDYECPEALHLGEVHQLIDKICSEEAFSLPRYDFKVGRRVEISPPISLPDGCVIIEGLHALNPALTAGLDTHAVLRLFVSVSTNINDGGERLISGRKIRFLRRLVRDSIYRASDAERTLQMWQEVLRAEDFYLYPYKERADVAFDTFHSFELGVMKPFAMRLLTDEIVKANEYAAIIRRALSEIGELDEKIVPQNSLIREFIPGGIYENLY